jgi:hypothetical protein
MQIVAMLLASATVSAQGADFQIVWINVGEVAAEGPGEQARAGRQLFMAPDLVEFSLNKVTIEKVDVQPTSIPLKIGQRFCLTSLRVQANSEHRGSVEDAPLSVSVRQDHRERLGLQREKRDICFRPNERGEYPVRFNSLLPARDGTTRGAQIFLRVAADGTTSGPAPAMSDD